MLKNEHTVIGNTVVMVVYSRGQRYEILFDAYHLQNLKGFRFNVKTNRRTKEKEIAKDYVYGIRSVKINGKTYQEREYLHRLLMPSKKGLQVDHINGKGMDNRDENLRYATPGKQGENRNVSCWGVTGIRNVYPAKGGRYRVSIRAAGKTHSFGTYKTKFEAERVAIAERKKLHPFSDPSARMDNLELLAAVA